MPIDYDDNSSITNAEQKSPTRDMFTTDQRSLMGVEHPGYMYAVFQSSALFAYCSSNPREYPSRDAGFFTFAAGPTDI